MKINSNYLSPMMAAMCSPFIELQFVVAKKSKVNVCRINCRTKIEHVVFSGSLLRNLSSNGKEF